MTNMLKLTGKWSIAKTPDQDIVSRLVSGLAFTRYQNDYGSVLCHRLQRWSNTDPTKVSSPV